MIITAQKSNKNVSLENHISKMPSMPSTRGGNYIDDDGFEVEFNKGSTMQYSNTSKPLQRDYSRRTTSKTSSTSRENSRHGVPADMGGPIDNMGPVDLDEVFDQDWRKDKDDAR